MLPFFSYHRSIIRTLKTVAHVAARPVRQLGPKNTDVFNVSDLIALLSQDFTYATSQHNLRNLKTHLLGEGKCGEELLPQEDSDNLELLKKLNAERVLFLIILALRYPAIWEFSQQLARAREKTLSHPRHLPSIYFNELEERFEINIHNRHLNAGDIFPHSVHQAVQQIRSMAEHTFGREVYIAPYTEKEVKDAGRIKEVLRNQPISLLEALKSFDMKAFLAQQREEIPQIAAVDSSADRRMSL